MMRGQALAAAIGLMALAAGAGCSGGGADSPAPPPRPTFTPAELAYRALWNRTVELRDLADERVANGWTDTHSAPTSDAGRELVALYHDGASCGTLRDALGALLAVADLTVSVADDVAARARGSLADHAYRWSDTAMRAGRSGVDLVRELCGDP